MEQQKCVAVYYDDVKVGEHRLDLIVEGCVLLELKAVEEIAPIHVAQAISSLKATRLEVALIINFNENMLKHGVKRIALSEKGYRSS